jgi:hypothetical protein
MLCTLVLVSIIVHQVTENSVNTGVLIIPWPDQEGNKLQRQKVLSFIYPIYNHNWRNISTIYTYIQYIHIQYIYTYIYIYTTRLVSNEISSPSKKIDREVGRTKDLSAPRYVLSVPGAR